MRKLKCGVSIMASGVHPVPGHPNAIPFTGCLSLVDVPSDKAPGGARGHCVVLTRSAAEAALPSLLGMAVDYKAGWGGHDARQKCGIIAAAYLKGERLMVDGFLFAKDFPEVKVKINGQEGLGMSYELHDCRIADMRESVWTITSATFTGAAILLREKAAYRGTSFELKSPKAAIKRVRKGAELLEVKGVSEE